ncbi:hypothetical protein [Pedobacter sp. L105]|uniref:hypothetical protein n=1 Tax=Pedobacter sp. L105 TaxID=1641871 RepID=UPI00131CCB69|nr:hypothetical protein [Pedobacter sp. L105]
MQKKRLYIVLNIFISFITAVDSYAQAPTINIPAANINAQSNFLTSNFASGNFPAVGLLTSATLRATTAGFIASSPSGNAAIPLGAMLYKVNSVSGTAQPSDPTITLSGAAQNVHAVLISLNQVAITSDYTVVTSAAAWLAGTYAATLAYQNVTPATATLTLVVPAYITTNTVAPAISTLAVTTLAAFRSGGGVSAIQNYDYYSTVPTNVTLQAGQSTFSFSTTENYNTPVPAVGANYLTATSAGTYAAVSPITLSSTINKPFSVSTGVPVVVTNKTSFSNTLSIAAADLKTQFVQAGTYTLPIVYTIAKTSSYAIAATSATMNSSIQVTVPKLSELTIPGGTTASLNFNTAASYNQGLTAAMSNPLTLSSTVPYTVTVKVSGDFTSGSNTIPASVATLERTAAETAVVNPIILSTTAQTLVGNSNPQIDRAINLQFRIPSTQTINLLNKPAGTYNTTVTFTIVAP